MPKKNSDAKYIVDQYANTKRISNVDYASDLFDRHTSCNPKFVSETAVKKYVKNKLDKLVKEVRYEKIDMDEVKENSMVTDMWTAINALKEKDENVPKSMSEDVYRIVLEQTDIGSSNTKKSSKKSKAPKHKLKSHDDTDDSEDDSEDDSDGSDNEEEDSDREESDDDEPVKSTKKGKAKAKANAKANATKKSGQSKNTGNKKKTNTKGNGKKSGAGGKKIKPPVDTDESSEDDDDSDDDN